MAKNGLLWVPSFQEHTVNGSLSSLKVTYAQNGFKKKLKFQTWQDFEKRQKYILMAILQRLYIVTQMVENGLVCVST